MDEYEKSLQVMDDDGAGSAITSIPAGQYRSLPDPVHHGDIFSRIDASTAGTYTS